MSKVSIITLGCKQNKYESDCMANILLNAGYQVTERLEFADIYILNTCAVTAEAEKKSRQYIAKINKLNNNAKIIVCGCASQNNPNQFEDKQGIYSIIGTQGKENILKLIERATKEICDFTTNYVSPQNPIKTTTREFLKIQDGCNNFCTYCLIPYLRGRSRSRDLKEIIAEAKLIATRSKEIVLTGIDISSYKIDGKPALGILMNALKDIPASIRIGSLEVNVITEEFMEVLASMPNFAPHFHLSLQSGDNEILKKMNRHYTREEYLDKVNLIRKYFPQANITTDVIVGFANETKEQFENTKSFIKEVGFSFVHIFPYSKRAGTVAFKFDDLPVEIKKQRVDELESVNKDLQERYLSQFIGSFSTVLIEERKELWEGFTPNYIRCYAEGNLECGEIYNIKFESIYKDGMKVKIIGKKE